MTTTSEPHITHHHVRISVPLGAWNTLEGLAVAEGKLFNDVVQDLVLEALAARGLWNRDAPDAVRRVAHHRGSREIASILVEASRRDEHVPAVLVEGVRTAARQVGGPQELAGSGAKAKSFRFISTMAAGWSDHEPTVPSEQP